ncbi:MAG TPA: histidine--tRNA ligase [Candidatus Paceibacterota bacterium]|nr:histidine--tRNA ligase [Candidatus Paceibacterota bacterium]
MSDKEPLSAEPYKGVRDFYPEDWTRLQACFEVIRKVLRSYGFEEYNASPLERAELYESKTSEEIVNEQTYTFTDRGDRRVTLRPEMTPTLARMVAAKRRELVYPLRWFSIGNRFRYERPQKGRLREFYQVDVDIIGAADAKAEGEAVVMAYEILKAFGAQNADFTIKANSRKLLNAACEAVGLSADETTAYLGLVDRRNKMDAEKFEAARGEYRRNGKDPLEVIEAHDTDAVEAEYQQLMGLIEALKARGMDNVVFDPSVVRGFLYYTGLVFEVFDTNPENPRALIGGGRYDGLVALFGGDPIPAVGFAMGDVTLIDFLTTHNLLPSESSAPELYIGTPSEEDIGLAQGFAEIVRTAGVRAMVNITDRSLSDQIREAAKRGIRYFAAYGAGEEESGTVRLKNLESGFEEERPIADVAAAIRSGS